MQGSAFNNTAAFAGRLLLAAILIQSGWNKFGAYEGTAAYMAKGGVPGALLPVVIAVELLGGILIASHAGTEAAPIGARFGKSAT